MKITVLSQFGRSLDLALKLQKEGNDVIFHLLTKKDTNFGKGLIPTKKLIGGFSADLIINDFVGLGETSDRLRRIGKLVIGGSIITDRLETDHEFGLDIMKACKIKVPDIKKFNDINKGIEFIKKNKNMQFIFKPLEQKQKFLIYRGRNTEDLVAMMENLKNIWPNEVIAFELQEFIDGIEIGIGGWFNGARFCKQVAPTFRYKKLMEGDKGPETAGMGVVACYRTHTKLFRETLAKVETFLKTTGYCGYVDLSCVVTENKAYGIEWTTHFGYPTLLVQDELHKEGSWGNFLYKLAQGLIDTVPSDTSLWNVGVAYCALKVKDNPIFLPKELEHIHLSDIWCDEGQYRQVGDTGYLCVCTGSDINLKAAKEKAYSVLKTIHTPNSFWRNDIGDTVIEILPKLKNWEWLK